MAPPLTSNLLLLVCVSFTIIGQPRNSVLIRRVTSNCSLTLIYRPQTDNRLSQPSWLTYSWPVSHRLSKERESFAVKYRCFTTEPHHQRGTEGRQWADNTPSTSCERKTPSLHSLQEWTTHRLQPAMPNANRDCQGPVVCCTTEPLCLYVTITHTHANAFCCHTTLQTKKGFVLFSL